MAVIHTGLGKTERTFELLEQAYAKRSPRMVYLNVDPRRDVLRGDSRFQSLLGRMKLNRVNRA